MAASKTRAKKIRKRRRLKPWEWVVIGAVIAFTGWAVWDWQARGGEEERFLALAAAGQDALSRVERPPSAGTGHTSVGESAGYRERFPASGRHDPQWINPGVYETAQPPSRLVHSLEHGMIVIYYDKPAAGVLQTLESWAGLYGGQWSGIVVVPAPGLGEEIVLTAWNRLLRLDPFEPASAAAFVDRFRGRGPENPVR